MAIARTKRWTQADSDRLQKKYDRETKKVVRILKEAKPERIIRFGSATNGMLRPYSDLDLCVILPATAEHEKRHRARMKLFQLLRMRDYQHVLPIDIHIYYAEEFEDQLRRGYPLLAAIARGETLYVGNR